MQTLDGVAPQVSTVEKDKTSHLKIHKFNDRKPLNDDEFDDFIARIQNGME